jgi:hypothetical protein
LHHLGTFTTKQAAALAYDSAARQCGGGKFSGSQLRLNYELREAPDERAQLASRMRSPAQNQELTKEIVAKKQKVAGVVSAAATAATATATATATPTDAPTDDTSHLLAIESSAAHPLATASACGTDALAGLAARRWCNRWHCRSGRRRRRTR